MRRRLAGRSCFKMGMQSLSLDESFLQFDETVRNRAAARWKIAMGARIHTDVRRIFHALTVPEYRETWMCSPGQGVRSRVAASQTDERFVLDFYRADRLDARVTGSYRVRRWRKLEFTWQIDGLPDSAPSCVEIRLLGDFGHTRLELLHRGLDSEAEYLWHKQMWAASLHNLKRLFWCAGCEECRQQGKKYAGLI